MGTARTPRERWVEEGLTVLADGGPDAVRVEALAKRLGVTKGGFYGYFADRDALLAAMLDTWEREAADQVVERVRQDPDGDPKALITLAGMLTFSGDRLRPIDLAVRDWARRDEAVAARLRRVDNRRMGLLREMIGTFCTDPDEVEARSSSPSAWPSATTSSPPTTGAAPAPRSSPERAISSWTGRRSRNPVARRMLDR